LADQLNWHLLQVLTGREAKVAKAIRRSGIEPYLPSTPKMVKVAPHRHTLGEKAIFPGYLFAHANGNWGSLTSIDGVIRLFCADNHPIVIPEAVIKRVREKEAELRGTIDAPPPITLAVGTPVRLIDCGSYSGLFSLVAKIDQERGLVMIELDLFCRKVPKWLKPEQVEIL
jgi:transcription antitermination factor NusG